MDIRSRYQELQALVAQYGQKDKKVVTTTRPVMVEHDGANFSFVDSQSRSGNPARIRLVTWPGETATADTRPQIDEYYTEKKWGWFGRPQLRHDSYALPAQRVKMSIQREIVDMASGQQIKTQTFMEKPSVPLPLPKSVLGPAYFLLAFNPVLQGWTSHATAFSSLTFMMPAYWALDLYGWKKTAALVAMGGAVLAANATGHPSIGYGVMAAGALVSAKFAYDVVQKNDRNWSPFATHAARAADADKDADNVFAAEEKGCDRRLRRAVDEALKAGKYSGQTADQLIAVLQPTVMTRRALGERADDAIKHAMEDLNDLGQHKEAGNVEKGEEIVIINNVKVKRRKGEQPPAEATPPPASEKAGT